MEDFKNLNTKYHVAKVSQESGNVEFISLSRFNGLFNTNSEMEGGSIKDPRKANLIISYMNNLYKEFDMGFYCYMVRVAENNTHVISDAPEQFQNAIKSYLGIEEPPADDGTGETEPPAEDAETPPEDGAETLPAEDTTQQ